MTGCGTLDKIIGYVEDKKEESAAKKKKNLINTELSLDEQNEIATGTWKEWKSDHKIASFFLPKGAEKWFAKKKTEYNKEAAATYKKAERDREKSSNTGFNVDTKKLLIIGIVLLVVILLIALFIKLIKDSRIQYARPRPQPQAPTVVNVTQSGPVNYDALLRERCSKLGISYEEILSNYGGDARLAYDATNAM